MIQSEWLKNKTGVLESLSQDSPNLGLSLNNNCYLWRIIP
jgi:hypothetical protein